ncbi:hypothetical protein PLICRDRAFT_43288 [Plicaturopsis crispa FD-325 SS-3]|nr:hypothetical protein PLICRDRAFT_43288 [Plicaturopsis crispa FD-325 SS-3]
MPEDLVLHLGRLPNELIVSIFTWAASSSTETCLALTLVASWVRDLALPYLLDTVVFRHIVQLMHFKQFVQRHSRYASLVRNICTRTAVIHPQNSTVLYDVIRACANVNSIVMHPVDFAYFAICWQLYPAFPLPRELHFTLAGPDYVQEVGPYPGATISGNEFFTLALESLGSRLTMNPPGPTSLFSTVTRLDMTGPFNFKPRPFTRNLFRSFSQLTHLKIPFECGTPAAELSRICAIRCLAHKPLVLLVLAINNEQSYEDAAFAEWFWQVRERDGRLCVTRTQYTVQDWDGAFERGMNIWDEAIRETEQWDLSRAFSLP